MHIGAKGGISMPDVATVEIRKAARTYVNYGLPVIPICPSDHRAMSLSHRQKCSSPGKSPIISDWANHTKTTIQDLNKWFDKNQYINIGIPLGSNSGIVGIDVDGMQYLDKLKKISNGDLPDTWQYKTGNGYRYLYRLPSNIETKKYAIRLNNGEIALLCDGQQTVLPPSNHASGATYRWSNGHSPDDLSLTESPEWLIDTITKDKSAGANSEVAGNESVTKGITSEDWAKTVKKGERNNHLTRLAGSLIARNDLPKSQILLFLQAWNQKHCEPPLDDSEINAMVESIQLKEEMHKAKKERETAKAEAKPFRPTPLAQSFLNYQRRIGKHWKYSKLDGKFYTTSEAEGPWEIKDMESVKKQVRQYITDTKHGGEVKWDTRHYVLEVFEALKSYLVSLESDTVFDLGELVHRGHYEMLDYIHLQNGLLEWKTGKLHPWNPNFHTTIQLPIDWNGIDVSCDTWEQTVAEWIPDSGTRKFLQEYVGLCLIPDTRFRTAVFLYGEGSNGKGLFIDTIAKLFGDSLSAVPLGRLNSRFETTNLRNKLVNICGDIDATYLKETGTIKGLISGDILRGEEKFGKSFDFRPVARLMFSANELPQVADKTHAWYSRWRFIKFPNTFPVDPSFKLQYHKAINRELSGILAWAVKGLRRLQEKNEFTVGNAMKHAAEQYQEHNDSVRFFLNQCCESVAHDGRDTTLAVKALWRVYSDWCDDEGLKNVSKRKFSRRAELVGFEKGRRSVQGRSRVSLLGIKLKLPWQSSYGIYLQT